MSENENIEAKLCSYVEGDLDAAGRGEIEKYLLANPQYRPLIAELAKTRGLLRGLPRTAAPAELLETLSGQIERSSLLGDGGDESMRIHSSRLPHLAAWAAVLLLTGGLGVVIYRVLPSNKAQSELALLKPAPEPASATQMASDDLQKAKFEQQDQMQTVPMTAAASPVVAAAPAAPAAHGAMDATTSPVADSLALEKKLTLSEPVAAADGLPTTLPALASSNSYSSGTVMPGGVSISNAASPQFQAAQAEVSGEATQLGQNMYVTLHAADEKAAGARVTQYLSDNGIHYEAHAMEAEMNGGAKVSAAALAPVPVSQVNATTSTDAPKTAAAPSYAFNSTGNAADRSLAENRQALQQSSVRAARMESDKELNSPQLAFTQPQGGSVIVARNLTMDQARRLTSDLSVKVQPVQINPLPAQQPVAMDEAPHVGGGFGGGGGSGGGMWVPLQTGERVRVVAKENGLPGVDAMDEPQTIDADGNLTLPLVGKVKAAGLTVAELEEKIPLAYRDAKSPTTETWTIERAATTQPVVDTRFALTPSVVNGMSAATQPAGVAEAKDVSGAVAGQQGIDVTIRVVGQPVAAALPTTEPAANAAVPEASTQPAAVIAMPPTAAPVTTMPTTAP